jgi:hypothetical protein
MKTLIIKIKSITKDIWDTIKAFGYIAVGVYVLLVFIATLLFIVKKIWLFV